MLISKSRTNLWRTLAAVPLAFPICSASAQSVRPSVGLKVDHAVSFVRGTYHLKPAGVAAVDISGRGYTIDFKGVTLLGDTGSADGIKITGEDITIRNLDVSGFKWGVVLEGCKRIRLENCNTSWNANLKPGTVIDESGNAPEDDHGGGIVVRDSTDCHFERCTAQHQWDGIDLVRSSRVTIQNGDFSYCGNWGVHLWNSSFNVFRHNRAVWCTTGGGSLYQALSGWQTYDAQAVGIDHNSCDNIIEQNDLRFGGDGIFIRANEGPITPGTVVPVKNGSHRNKLLFNDCSFSPNNAIEVDLVDDTQIIGNNCSFSNYGLWLGYSRRCIVSGNTCVSDTNHCVEIENGQDDVFNYNVFSAGENARADYQMVLLRQNGRDKTPSGPYLFDHNSFYGKGTGVVLTDTAATLQNNTAYMPNGAPSTAFYIVKADAASKVTAAQPLIGNTRQLKALLPTHTLVPSKDFTFRLKEDIVEWPLPTVSLNGIPMWVRSSKHGTITVHVPEDNWLRPAADSMLLTIVSANGDTDSVPVKVAWSVSHAAVTSVTPQTGTIGNSIVIEGHGLNSGSILLNNRPAEIESKSDTKVVLKPLSGILLTSNYNLLWQSGEGRDARLLWPMKLTVEVPREQMPHLIGAEFSPKQLHVGDRIKVKMTVRNNLPIDARLTVSPPPPFTYDETQASYEMGYNETEGYLHLRVSTDFFVGGHHPGSWPWLFGFDKSLLKPGETITVMGYVRAKTPGKHVYRIGLVAGGFRFIDDNAYQTQIEVLP